MATTEHTVNDAIAEALRTTRHGWGAKDVVRSENTATLAGSNKRPDILITEPGVSPVVIETEILPALTVEAEAIERLGETLRADGRRILSSIALRSKGKMRKISGSALAEEVATTDEFEFALFTGENPISAVRWPQEGWITGSIRDLSILAQAAAVPPAVVEKAADQLMTGVQQAAGQLAGIETKNPGALTRIAKALCQEDGEQTRRMATTILANAFMFHENLAHGPSDLGSIRNLAELEGADQLTRDFILAEWRAILKVNYWPIFDIACKIFEVIPPDLAKALARTLARTAAQLVENSLTRSHDLTGAVFQKLIVDRKFLAAYYTTPASAALMIGLALDKSHAPNGKPWSDRSGVEKLKVGDFACGTGTLLSTAYTRLGQYFELNGGNSEQLHPAMMASVLVGADVLPAAAHLTAAMLSGAHPQTVYTDSHIMTVPYGAQGKGKVALGSLDLLANDKTFDAIAAVGLGAKGATKKDVFVSVAHESFDLVVMNPPFTRPTGQEANKVGVPNPMFAAFSADKNEQKEMKTAFDKLLAKLTGDHCYDGQAGEASGFIELGHRKLKPGGALGLITPLSLMSGEAWDASRKKIAQNYDDVMLLSITGKVLREMSFSADTGMAEAMTLGVRRKKARETNDARATFVVLDDRPTMPLDGYAVADAIRDALATGTLSKIEDPPLGGSAIMVGNDVVGHAIEAPLPSDATWDICRIADLALAQSAWRLTASAELWLPAMPAKLSGPLPLKRVGEMVAFIGPYHADINWNGSGGAIRGPFKLKETKTPEKVTYPILWTHDADRERAICFEADNEGIARPGKTPDEKARILEKVNSVVATASHLHFNQNFRFNSQSTAMQYTKRRTIGGRAWMTLRFPEADMEAAVTLWGNTTLGLLLHWWQANKQQAGRGNIGKTALANFVCLDPAQLSDQQRAASVVLLESMGKTPLRPFNEIDLDDARAELDRAFLGGVLGLPDALFTADGPLALLRRKLAAEPSVAGSKKRPDH
ncbi:MAG: hypothetical protein HC788_07840 [Sphingopyxis sp.]|nr:hypothetical protein [Sphingopyxis sp.]